MSTITGFYTGFTESEVEKQFADLRDINTASEFINYLNRVINTIFTEDYFRVTLPSELNSSSAISPAWYGYIASLNVLGTPMLFSTTPLSNYFILGTNGGKKTIDKLLEQFGTEMTILHKLSDDDIESAVGDKIAKNIIAARDGKMNIVEGGGGNYGQVKLD